ncbi:MAG: DegV family protein [Caldilineae bacterium]|nr:MAG: DegV family protein [Caldilineae bacterium]
MSTIALVADSGCDLPRELLDRYRIEIVPLITRFGTQELPDLPETRAQFWQRYNLDEPAQTSAPSVGAWAEAFAAALSRAEQVLAITITGKHSSTYNSACIAAREFAGRVHVFDSWSLSLGEGLLVLRAAQAIAEGLALDAILEELHALRARLRVIFFLDTLDAVQRGGRLAPVMTAIKRMSSLLSIKPILTIREGVIGLEGAVRSRNKGVRRILDELQGKSIEAVAVAHTRLPSMAERLADAASEITYIPRSRLLIAEAGPAFAVHAGPGAFGLAYVPVVSDNR